MKSKRHHYLAQFYLKRFCRDGKLWLYDRDKDEYRRQTPKNTALEKHLYSLDKEDGQKDDELEKILARAEGLAKPVLDKIDKRDKIAPYDKESLSWFLGMQYFRTPSSFNQHDEMVEYFMKRVMKNAFSSVANAEYKMKDIEEKTGQKLDTTPEEMVEFAQSDDYKIHSPKEYKFENLMECCQILKNYYTVTSWKILVAPEKESFITSDCPVTVINTDQDEIMPTGLVGPRVQHFIPISSQCCLLVRDFPDDIDYFDCSNENVREVNLLNAWNSSKYVIGRDKPLLESIVRNTRLKHRPKGPIKQLRVGSLGQ